MVSVAFGVDASDDENKSISTCVNNLAAESWLEEGTSSIGPRVHPPWPTENTMAVTIKTNLGPLKAPNLGVKTTTAARVYSWNKSRFCRLFPCFFWWLSELSENSTSD